jgi:hypothetical protein
MARTAWIAALVAGGVLVLLLLAAALVVAAGSGEESIETSGVLTLDPSARSLEIPLAATGNALTVASRNGRVLVGLAVDPAERIQVAVVRGERAVPISDLTFTVDGRLLTPRTCGHACWELDVRQPRELVVNAPETFRFELPAVLPPSAAGMFAAVTRTMESLRTYRFDEDLTSGVGALSRSTWEVQAPDRMRFRTSDGFRAVVVGRSRWDFRGGRWQRSAYPRLDLPSYMWDGAAGARVLPGAGGNSAILAVFDREPVPAWFKLTIDDQNHVVDAEMLAPSHFMRQRFYDFNVPLTIEPPAP